MEIFVFGANTEGRHGKGAALFAKQHHGAIYGNVGLMVGDGVGCYGVITKELRKDKPSITLDFVRTEIDKLIRCACDHPEYTFKCTPFGTGLAGFTHDQMARLFDREYPANIILPDEWRQSDLQLKYDGGYYLTDGIHRTRLYTTPHACEVAIERGQFYTEAEYRKVVVTPKRTGNGIRRLNAVIRIEK